jgi:hypothetical protein
MDRLLPYGTFPYGTVALPPILLLATDDNATTMFTLIYSMVAESVG